MENVNVWVCLCRNNGGEYFWTCVVKGAQAFELNASLCSVFTLVKTEKALQIRHEPAIHY